MRSSKSLFFLTVTAATFAGAAWAVEKSSEPVPVATAKVSPSAATHSKHPANLAQLMQGTLFAQSNVVFAAQGTNPADIPKAETASTATDPLTSTYGKWQAVENASLAITESADLLSVPGRLCSNGRKVPVDNADWPKLVDGLRDAGLKSYEAARSKNKDNILDAADILTTACSNCHRKYRDAGKLEDRCK